jgi:formylglycine-generating enzyme required for sulfatase activity
MTSIPISNLWEIEDQYISQVNYDGYANWNNTARGNVTTVGTNGSPSYYCTYDQSGNVWELIDINSATNVLIRGGSWSCGDLYTISSSYRKEISIYENDLDYGIRLCSSVPHAFSEWSYVADIDNMADDSLFGGYGTVGYNFYIQKYPITNNEYKNFLNIVDSCGLNRYRLYSPLMMIEAQGGITYNISRDVGDKYGVKVNMGDKPVVCIDWFRAARLANWIHNGANSDANTENGVYELLNNSLVSRNISGSRSCWIPTENEWYKAAFYDPTKISNKYWKYATRNDITPQAVSKVDTYGNGPCKVSCS